MNASVVSMVVIVFNHKAQQIWPTAIVLLNIQVIVANKQVNRPKEERVERDNATVLLVSGDPCLNYQCNHGTCQKDRNNQPYCSCYEGYGGSRCETQIGKGKRAMMQDDPLVWTGTSIIVLIFRSMCASEL